jgi:predicted DCC family thiol-disulfide oxidoreductase YuxK
MPQLIASMHGVRPDGSVLKGVDVFAELYDAVGWSWLAKPLRWRLTRPLAKAGYRVFAAIRPRLSRFRADACETDRCSPKNID